MTRFFALAGLVAIAAWLPGCAAWNLAPYPAELEVPAGGADLDVEICGGLLWVEVTLDGHGPYASLLDTGAQITVLDTAVAREAFPGRVESVFFLEAQGAHGKSVPIDGRVRVHELVVGELVARDLDAIVMDLSHVAGRLGRRFDGIVGYPVFFDADLVIDYPAGRAFARRHGADSAAGDAPAVIPLLPGSEPRIELLIEGRTVRCLVDTGAGTRFTVQDLDKIVPGGPHPIVGVRRGVDGDILSRAARLDGSIDLGPLRYERPIVHGARRGNRIGGSAFADARITFDQRRRVLLVEPARDAPIRTPPIHHLDVVFEKHPNGWTPARTLSGAALVDAGLREEDRVIAVDGVSIGDLLCVPLEQVLDGKTRVDVTVLRDGATLTLPLAVVKRLEDASRPLSKPAGD